MITVTGRLVAFVVLLCSCGFVIAVTVFSALHGGPTHSEAVASTGGVVVAVVSWLWLRRNRTAGDDDDDMRPECPYDGCDHGETGGRR